MNPALNLRVPYAIELISKLVNGNLVNFHFTNVSLLLLSSSEIYEFNR